MPPISRRSLMLGGAALVGASVTGPPHLAHAGPVPRPTGKDYIRYEDLYRSGDTVAGALARLTTPKIVTFPEGRFECRDFNSGYQAGIQVPSICRGIVGSGRGDVGSSFGTVFAIKPRSSTKGRGARDSSGRLYVPPQDDSTPCQLNVLKQLNQKAPAVWKHFQVAGTEQGHIFSGFQVHGTAGANVFKEILVSGWDGNAGAPPGETSGLAVSGPGAHRLTSVWVDGRRRRGGEIYGAMGITVQNTVGVVLERCHGHYCRAASFVAFQSVNGLMKNCCSKAVVPPAVAVGNGSINFERTAGWRMVNQRIEGRPRKVHITHSNDNWSLVQSGKRYPVANGRLTVVNPTYNDLWDDRLLYVQSWTPYWNGDSMKTAPVVLKANGRSRLPFKWVHDRHYLVR